MINLHTPGEFDLTWGDMYSYLLYTRGGPYWQVSKVSLTFSLVSVIDTLSHKIK